MISSFGLHGNRSEQCHAAQLLILISLLIVLLSQNLWAVVMWLQNMNLQSECHRKNKVSPWMYTYIEYTGWLIP